jgi:hypothetical protein
MNLNGISTCGKGQENYEKFSTKIGRKRVIRFQYDYRTESGKLFSCIGKTLEQCRSKRDEWINNN